MQANSMSLYTPSIPVVESKDQFFFSESGNVAFEIRRNEVQYTPAHNQKLTLHTPKLSRVKRSDIHIVQISIFYI